ncbi:ATP-binding cassette domain-containing protein [Hymenobacter setariae]|uniref:ATP-binding cassette domain-containing protein n=1 Tax=Hymenobacter setariae TaxID=2594794 RepID=A0A558C436_9BACT|nr:ABC transporter ATP-binding protein [Hymenobacter setariae]TVT43524.1 ATP-binding cassette domain-containing protein [Hymenobacter setariae]
MPATATSEPVVQVRNLSKKFCGHLRTSLWYGLRDIAAETWPRRHRPAAGLRRAEFWSLQDVSFELHRGEALAIIGANGAGKSTLLKLLNGLIKPDTGSIRLLGQVGALIELGVGLDPVLTGRENVFVRAALMGFSRAGIAPLLPAIIEFTGLGEAIDMPVQFYSSGMVSRLAYAVAAHLHPDILLVDEVLAVGDFDFQRKCINHMMSYLAAGGSLILVSHQPHHIQSICRRGVVLDKGRITFSGTATEALDYYFSQQLAALAAADSATGAGATLSEARPVAIEGVALAGQVAGTAVQVGDEVELTLTYQSFRARENAGWAFFIHTSDGHVCITGAYSPQPTMLLAGQHTLSCRLPNLPLTAGDYLVKTVIFEFESLQPLALWGWENSPTRLQIVDTASLATNAQKMVQQLITVPVTWP